MTRKWSYMVIFSLLLIVPLVAIGGEGGAKKKRRKKAKMVKIRTVASVGSLMVGQRLVLGELSKTVKSETTPKTLETIAHLSEVLAELSNVNSVGQKKESGYRKFARTLRDHALKLRDKAKTEPTEADDMLALITQIKNTCSACHNQFR